MLICTIFVPPPNYDLIHVFMIIIMKEENIWKMMTARNDISLPSQLQKKKINK